MELVEPEKLRRWTRTEGDVRRALGIPDDAHHVIVFGESSHWDPDWLHTADEYFRSRVQHTLDRALEALAREPARVYSIDCVFFLKLYWERRPERRADVRRFVNERRLRLTGSGVTTPDTVLPSTEALIRDLLYGQCWLHSQGMTQEPSVLYLPDNFGNTPALPSLLTAAGIHATAFARLDGGYFAGADLRPASEFPEPGSSAYELLRRERSLDFVWRDAAGAEVLARYHAWGYGQGDLLAHRGLTRWMEWPLAYPDRSEAHVARRIERFASDIGALSRTPYLFCPIGFDFVDPIRTLTPLLERYNRSRYPVTGIFAVNAALDDYFDLLSFHRSSLPVIELDPNPYWTGFYSSRPARKSACRRAVDSLLHAEQLELAASNGADPEKTAYRGPAATAEVPSAGSQRAVDDAWFWAMVGNHHDFITGTAPDRVYEVEQRPRIEEAIAVAEQLIAAHRTSRPARAASSAPRWRRENGAIEIENGHLRLTIDPSRGGCVTSLFAGGERYLDGPSLDLVAHHDSGGLWRMGHEYPGGALRVLERASERPALVEVCERDGELEIVTRVDLAGDTLTRTIGVNGAQPDLRVRVTGKLSPRRTITLASRTPFALETRLDMGVPAGVARRPLRKLYAPTFWAFDRFAHVRASGAAKGIAILAPGPATISASARGALESVALRHAVQERVYGVLPLLAFPAKGSERGAISSDVTFRFTPSGDWLDNGLHRAASDEANHSLITIDDPDALVLAAKRAWRGTGVIVRIYTPARERDGSRCVRLRINGHRVERATRTDALERDIEDLRVEDGAAAVPVREAITTVRAIVSDRDRGIRANRAPG